MRVNRLDRFTKIIGWYCFVGLVMSQLISAAWGGNFGLTDDSFFVFTLAWFLLSWSSIAALWIWLGCKVAQFVRRRRAR